MLDQIINVCSQENNLSNLQIKSFMIAFAGLLKKDKPNQPINMIDEKIQEEKDKESQINKLQLDRMKEQLNRLEIQLKKEVQKKVPQIELNNIEQKIKKDILKSISNLEQSFKQDINKLFQKIKELSLSSSNQKKQQKLQYAKYQLSNQQKAEDQGKKDAFQLQKWLILQSQNNLLVLKNRTITAVSNAFAFGTTKLRGKSSFRVRFNKIVEYVGVGINEQYKTSPTNWLCYYSHQVCHDEPGWRGGQGSGYRAGQIITIEIDKIQGTMKWIVDSEIRHKVTADLLKDKKLEHVPFLQFVHKGDQVQILE